MSIQILVDYIYFISAARQQRKVKKLSDILFFTICARHCRCDALGCQKDIASKVKDKKADYLLAVKDNQSKLHQAYEEKFPVFF